jgi:dihydrofolate reductase
MRSARTARAHEARRAKGRIVATRKIIAALQVSLDGLIEGPDAEVDWIDNWDDPFDVLPDIDTCILGGGMYPGYERYWLSILSDPTGSLPFTGRPPTEDEVAYARFADRTPHLVLSSTLESVEWETARIVRDVEEIRRIKAQPGRSIHAVGGATLVSSLMNEGLIDEIRLTAHPIVLGRGKALFAGVRDRHALELLDVQHRSSGRVNLSYAVAPGGP